MPLYRRLPPEDREELLGHIHVLWAEKHFEGADGLTITDRMKLVVASQAALLLLHRRTDYFPKLVSVLLYPAEYAVTQAVSSGDGLVQEIEQARAGESWSSGTLVLSWEDVVRDLRRGSRNVVLHEFAHQLDAENGEANGAPVLADRELKRRWAETMTDAYERLIDASSLGRRSPLDPYGAETPAEFFAVATEAFFLTPRRLQGEEPDLYRVLRDYYRQHPAAWSSKEPTLRVRSPR